MKDGTYITIQSWMRTELGLKGNDLIVYAIIFGFSQTENTRFTGSLQYLADWCGATKQGILKNIKNLLDKGLIEKNEEFKNGIKFVEYYATKLNTPLNKVEYPIKQSLTNNIASKTDNSKKVVSKDTTTEFSFGKKSALKKPNLYTTCLNMIDAKTTDATCRLLLRDWLNMLLEKYRGRGKVLYANVFKGKLNMLDKFDEKDWADIIRYNIQRGYEGFYPISDYSSSSVKNKPWEKGVTCETDTDEFHNLMRRRGKQYDE